MRPPVKPRLGALRSLDSEGLVADLKEVRVVQLPAHQAIEGAGKTDGVGQGGFGDPLPFHLVMQQAILFFDRFN